MNQVLKKYLVSVILIVFSFSFYSQSNAEAEKEVVNLQISFQQNRFTNPNKARKDIDRAIVLAKGLENKTSLLTCKILLGEFFDDNNNFNASFRQYSESIDLASEIKDDAGLAKAKYNVGFLFYKQNTDSRRQQSLRYFNESILLSEKLKDDFLKAKALNLISFIQYDLNELNKSERSALEALDLFKKINKKNRIPQCYLTLARVNNKKDNFEKAIGYLDDAILLYENSNNHLEKNNALLVKSEVYLRKKDYRSALTIAEKIDDDPKVMTEQKIYVLQLLYEINKSMNNHKRSLDYLEENKMISDSLFKIDRGKMEESVRAEIEAKSQLKSLEKENEINELKIKQNNYLIVTLITVSVVLLLIALVMYLIFRQSKLRAEREKIQLEQESMQMEQNLLRTQMNPHFIANTLAAIQGNIYKQDKEKSVTYISKFAKLMRFILESSRKKEIVLSKEIKSLRNYLDLQKLLLEEKLSYQINISNDLKTDEILIPPMLIQPYVENAIKHGVELNEANGTVSLNFVLSESNKIKVEVIDDGKGIEEVSEIYKRRKSNHLSFSTNITKERIDNLNKKSGDLIEAKIDSIIKEGEVKGTKVTLLLPVKNMFD